MLMPKVFDEKTLKEYSPQVLAYVGDAAFELMVRTHLIQGGNRRMNELHQEAVEVVKARTQAHLVRQLYDDLSREEQDIVRRGRNAKGNPPRHAQVQDYRLSTGFEALMGYLYLKGDEERLLSIVEQAFLFMEQDEDPGADG